MIVTASSRRSAIAAIWLVAIAALCLGMSGCGGESGKRSLSAEERAARSDSLSVVQPSVTDGTALPLLLDLGSTTCVPCKAMAPILEEMSETFAGQFDVRFEDVKKDAALARTHGVRIIPTQIFFDERGKELSRHQGFFSREDMLATWEELGYVFNE